MKLMQHRGFKALIEFDAADEIFTGRILGINDVVGFHADSVAGLKDAFGEAVDDYVETCRRIGKEPEKPFSGNLMLRVDPLVHASAVIAAQASGKSLNAWSEEVLKAAAEKAA